MSVRVKVLLHANFRETVGKREIIEEINSNSTLRDILDKLAQKYGRDFKQIVDPGTGAISLEFLVSINGRIMRDANVKLNNDDVLILSIPVGGG
ncbi:MoaD family protein [Candidatus Bathyarchaeota archaeon]|nr:MAG: MoaD family protein [Candidatus Bathyarchaeota archaeon]